MLNNYFSCQLADIFDISFASDIFPPALTISKVVPIHKKGSKLDFSMVQSHFYSIWSWKYTGKKKKNIYIYIYIYIDIDR